MKLHALICAYNCADTIFDCLDSLVNIADEIDILDNKWIGYKGRPLHSTDGTLKEINRFMSLHSEIELYTFKFNEEVHQYEARNFLIKQVKEGDWFLVIDSDEIVTQCPYDFKWYLFRIQDIKGLRISYAELGRITPQLMDMPRFFRKTKGLHWTNNHRYLDDNEGPLNYRNMAICNSFAITHIGENKKMRPKSEEYKHWLTKWEAKNHEDNAKAL